MQNFRVMTPVNRHRLLTFEHVPLIEVLSWLTKGVKCITSQFNYYENRYIN